MVRCVHSGLFACSVLARSHARHARKRIAVRTPASLPCYSCGVGAWGPSPGPSPGPRLGPASPTRPGTAPSPPGNARGWHSNGPIVPRPAMSHPALLAWTLPVARHAKRGADLGQTHPKQLPGVALGWSGHRPGRVWPIRLTEVGLQRPNPGCSGQNIAQLPGPARSVAPGRRQRGAPTRDRPLSGAGRAHADQQGAWGPLGGRGWRKGGGRGPGRAPRLF
jgi:hypothetical protein